MKMPDKKKKHKHFHQMFYQVIKNVIPKSLWFNCHTIKRAQTQSDSLLSVFRQTDKRIFEAEHDWGINCLCGCQIPWTVVLKLPQQKKQKYNNIMSKHRSVGGACLDKNHNSNGLREQSFPLILWKVSGCSAHCASFCVVEINLLQNDVNMLHDILN